MNVGVPELVTVLAVVLLVFGPNRLPDLARSLGDAAREFRRGQTEGDGDTDRSAS